MRHFMHVQVGMTFSIVGPYHLQKAMSLGVKSMLELSHVLVLLGVDVIIGKVHSQPFYLKLHLALLYVIDLLPPLR